MSDKKQLVEPITLKGFQDYLPEETIARKQVIRAIEEVFERYGFVPLETPALEHLDSLLGAGSEEHNKELFCLESPEGEPIALRFDLTVPFARLLAQYPDKLKAPVRRYAIGPVWRADKPGPGRFRHPQRDTLRDLTQRMRRFASDVFTARDISFGFHGPDPELGTRLRADLRREIFLVFKESANNIVRHSQCTRAEIEFGIEGRRLVMRLSDDGLGFDTAARAEGHGLMSMRKRAERLHGEIEIVSGEGRGTTITLRVPLGRR